MLSGGENVSPARIEGMLMAEPEIAQAVVAGDGRAGLTALVVPADGLRRGGAWRWRSSRVNKRLSVTERIRRHAVVPAFTLENGLLTPTQKIRRLLVLRANADEAGADAGVDCRPAAFSDWHFPSGSPRPAWPGLPAFALQAKHGAGQI